MFLWRHRRTLAVLAIAGSGAVWGAQYAFKKLLEQQTVAADAARQRERLKAHFVQIQESAKATLESFLPNFYEEVARLADVDSLRTALEQARSAKADAAPLTQEQKLAQWEQLKVESFVQALASVYVLAAAALLVRIQMNVLGRYSYLDILHGAVVGTEDGDAAAAAATATPAAAAPARALLESAERAYLSLPIYLLRRGVPTLVQLVRDAIAEPLAGLSVRRKVSREQVADVLRAARATVERDRLTRVLAVLLPEEGQEAAALPPGVDAAGLQQALAMIAETRDLATSADGAVVLERLLDAAFGPLHAAVDAVFADAVRNAGVSVSVSGVGAGEEARIPLPNVVACMGRQARLVLSAEVDAVLDAGLYVNAVFDVDEGALLAGSIYTSFEA